jgi:aspartate/methionine/tyrosine aminotransferase
MSFILQVKAPNGFKVDSLSKTFNMAELEVGMLLGNAACIDAVFKSEKQHG